MRRDNPNDSEITDIKRRLRELETASPVGSTSVTSGVLRIASPEGLLVEGSAYVSGILHGDGEFNWSGDMNLSGSQNVTGPVTFTGAVVVNGNISINGAASISGTTTISGATTLSSTLTISSGQILAGDVTVTPTGGGRVQVGGLWIDGALGGSIHSGSTINMGDGETTAVRVVGGFTASRILALGTITGTEISGTSLDISGAKSFRIDHPTKPGTWLRHGSTESPVSGTEYTGRATLDGDGRAVVALPDYFEALNKSVGRTVQVTPVGVPFMVGADDVADGKVTLYGEPERDVFWLVKAERHGADFLLEESQPFQEDV
ncbi:hypothetical protein [Microbacterium sp. NPDC056052]|uniref:hypothetical protein n=1 Tax=Microbacterium sp. NPDC056052 TaxID=3345695 RepID=UPI0035DF0A06